MPIVTDTNKQVTDEVLKTNLARQGIDWRTVEFFQDYAYPQTIGGKREKGKSPFAKFYRHTESNKGFAVISQLPMVRPDGAKIVPSWSPVSPGGRAASGANLFSANINRRQVQIINLYDQPDGRLAGQQVTFTPQLFLNGVEVLPISNNPILLPVDPLN